MVGRFHRKFDSFCDILAFTFIFLLVTQFVFRHSQQSLYWDPVHTGQVYQLWYHVAAARLRDMISKAKTSGNKPEWISSEIWEAMMEYWSTDEAKKKSRIASANRLSDRDGFGPHRHTSGAISYEQLRSLIVSESKFISFSYVLN